MDFFKTTNLSMSNEIKKINLNHSFVFFLFSNIFSLIIFKFNNFNISPLICLLINPNYWSISWIFRPC